MVTGEGQPSGPGAVTLQALITGINALAASE